LGGISPVYSIDGRCGVRTPRERNAMNIDHPLVSVPRRSLLLLMCAALGACASAPPRPQAGGPAASRSPSRGPADQAESPTIFGAVPDGGLQRLYSRIYDKAAEAARLQFEQRAFVQEAADQAADAVQVRADDERKRIGTGEADPDDSAELAAENRRSLLAAFDAQTAADIKAARQRVIDDARRAQRYVEPAKSEADLQAALDALHAEIDAVYSNGIPRAVEKLKAEYELPDNPRRVSAEKRSGYTGEFYRLDRVERYFKETWAGDRRAATIENCKAALGFKKEGVSVDLKDPTADNVDELCGVREGLVALLSSYRGSKKSPAEPSTADVEDGPEKARGE
jgi:hypothetical protein